MRFKQLIYTLFLSATLMFAFNAFSQSSWQEGKHYEVIADKAASKKHIREVFSFWCPHCFTFESIVTELKSQLPSHVKFVKAHANFMASTSVDVQNDATRAMLAAKAIKQDGIFNQAMFEAIHKQRKNVQSMDDILAIFSAAGGDSQKLEKMAKSFGIRGQVKRNDALARGVNSVPTFIVNDKYQAIFTREMTPDQFVALLLWLTEQP